MLHTYIHPIQGVSEIDRQIQRGGIKRTNLRNLLFSHKCKVFFISIELGLKILILNKIKTLQ